jgi:hypothetical protein
MRRRIVLLVVVGSLAVAGAAAAQELVGTNTVDIVSGGSPSSLRLTSAKVTLTGSLSVDFRSDPATCAAVGRCGLEGTVAWRTPRRGQLAIFERTRGRRTIDAYLAGDPREGLLNGRLFTTAQVRRDDAAGRGLCSDGNPDSATLEVEGSGGELVFALRGGGDAPDLLATRCPGPLLGDVAGGLVTRRVSLATLRRGATKIDLGGDSPFTAAGLTGTAHSDVVLTVGRARTERDRLPASVRRRRQRVLDVEYHVTRVSGGVRLDVRGDPDAASCGPLDACGLTGAHVVTPSGATGSASLSAFGPARTSTRALRAAVGLAPGHPDAGITAYGTALWTDRGRDEVSIGRAGQPPCTDRRPLRDGYLALIPHGSRVQASYFPGVLASLHTRCPGPKPDGPLATGSLPLRAFAHRRVTVRLRAPKALNADGYTGTVRPDLTVVLTRRSLRERVVTG